MVTITEVAIRYPRYGVMHKPAPFRHHNLIHELAGVLGKAPDFDKLEQGFLTSEGEYVCRLKAGEIAIEAKQIEKLNHPPDLYSEDLW